MSYAEMRAAAEKVLTAKIRKGYPYAVGNSERCCWVDGYVEAMKKKARSTAQREAK